MSKKSHLLIEIGLGIVITALVSWSFLTRRTILETANLKTYDIFTNFRKSPPKLETIRLVEIDENSVNSLGSWPWARSIVAQLVDAIVDGNPKVIGLAVLFAEPSQNIGLELMERIESDLGDYLAGHKAAMRRKGLSAQPLEDILAEIRLSKEDLDSDGTLARSIHESGLVVLPMYFHPGEAFGANPEPESDLFTSNRLPLKPDASLDRLPTAMSASMPIDAIGEGALAIGHCTLLPDMDGTLRRIAPVMRYGKSYFPSFGLQLTRVFGNYQMESVQWDATRGLTMQKESIPLDETMQTYISYAGPAGTFQRYSAVDVLTGALPEGALKNKIVLVGLTAPGLVPLSVGPGGTYYNALEIWANHTENILNQRFIQRPRWAKNAEWGFIGLAALLVVFGFPLLKARFAIPMAAAVLAGLMGTGFFFFVKKGWWVSPSYGLVLLVIGFLLLLAKRLLFTERGKELVEAESVETNKMLGLSFQGQGMLDLAFEKFRRCPVDASLKDLLYNLGLDMERKRQFAKAAAVYEHIFVYDPKYKDISEKIAFLKKAGEGAVFPGLGKKGSDATVVVDGLGQNTTLGRYEVIRELGRGAMGIVYLGRDPKINRQVAIKTLRFEDEVDEQQAKAIKERFFREAESAGNLTHPNIIRIFDAGEDQDVAYIAMELLEGEDFKKYCEKPNLLPVPRVVEMMINVADALDYANRQGVVHRDIKPANIMLLKDNTLRLTDFGIARIQATSKTATGAVLGTPAYMSPEQVNGKKADGRADIFSLGVTFFELLTGEKPFHADSIAALLYRIANVPHPDPREFNSRVPAAVVPIINKALEKDPEKRYQTAGEMAADLRTCMRTLGEPPLPDKPAEKPADTVAKKTQPEKRPPQEPRTETQTPASPATPAEPDKFLSELQETFHIGGDPKTKAAESSPSPAIDETVVEPRPAADKTVIETKPLAGSGNPPISSMIEHGYQPTSIPPETNDNSDEKRKGRTS